MKKYIPLRLNRKEIDALQTAIQTKVISDLNDFPEALLYWNNGRSFYIAEDYYKNSVDNIDAILTYPNIPFSLRQDLEHILNFMRSSLFSGMVQPADISGLRDEMEDYKIWITRLQ